MLSIFQFGFRCIDFHATFIEQSYLCWKLTSSTCIISSKFICLSWKIQLVSNLLIFPFYLKAYVWQINGNYLLFGKQYWTIHIFCNIRHRQMQIGSVMHFQNQNKEKAHHRCPGLPAPFNSQHLPWPDLQRPMFSLAPRPLHQLARQFNLSSTHIVTCTPALVPVADTIEYRHIGKCSFEGGYGGRQILSTKSINIKHYTGLFISFPL